jgi:hypothetical protein
MISIGKLLHILLFYTITGYMNEFATLNIYNPLYNRPPLIDFGFKYLPIIPVSYSTYSLIGIIIYFFIKFRRRFDIIGDAFWLLGVLFIFRMVAFSVTLVPPATTNCDVRHPGDPIRWNVVKSLINDKDTACSDYMYSGHALHIIILSLYIYKYSISKMERICTSICVILSLLFIICGRIHYTTDVVVAILVGTPGYLLMNKS